MELYSANHAETVEQLLGWPWRRFERFYEAFLKRSIVETLEQRKNQMIGSLWSNSNWDDDKGTRQKAIEDLENSFDEAVATIHFGGKINEESAVEITEENPFFASTRKAIDKVIESTSDYSGEGTVQDVINQKPIADR